NAILERFSGTPVTVDILLARAGDLPIRPVSDHSGDDLSRLFDLNNVTQQTVDDLRSAMWHPSVLADAQPKCGRHNAWASMCCRLAWFIGTEFENQARELWLEWSVAGGGSAADITEAELRWDDGKLVADRTGYQAIFTRAQKEGWINPGAERMRLSSVTSVDDFEELPPEEQEKPRSFPHSGGYGKPGKFIVEGLLSVGVNIVYGPSSSFKSYFVIAILCRIAMKTHRWAGRNLKGGAVLYAAAEGGSSVMPRVGAWADKYNEGKPVELFYALPLAVDLSVPEKVSAIIKKIRRIEQATGEQVRAVAVDTLSQSMMQCDENSASDIAKFMAGATRIVNETGTAVIPVHHSGKGSSKGMRGSSAAFANADTVIRVERIGDAVNLINEKQRTGPAQPTRGYLLPTVQLPDAVIAANEAYDADYTSTVGDVYDPVRLTTERVFDDVPLAEIEPLMIAVDDAREGKVTTQDWILEHLDDAGGRICRDELRKLWIEEGRKEATFRQGIRRLIQQNDIAETTEGLITYALCATPSANFDEVKHA
ncbi:AAA family ATPase, partial [Candidatus Symbiopectobacterium sp.]|uniref:AAA family ATPase n=1 Tax=Candidatus Symbiopectobacterium sp. TaxID=2816440 RepID=UPI0025BD3E98